ncbi:MAG: CHAP domain-containing protein [Nanoarchaeota archaeon]
MTLWFLWIYFVYAVSESDYFLYAKTAFAEFKPKVSPKLEEFYIVAQTNPTLPKKLNLTGGEIYYCNCIEFAKYVTGNLGEYFGNAWEIESNSSIPAIGSLVLMNSRFGGHVGIIVDIKDNILSIIEGGVKCKKNIRDINIDSPEIRGFRTL